MKDDRSGDWERFSAGMADLASQQARILERIERLVALTEEMWEHQLRFSSLLIEELTGTQIELLEGQNGLGSRIDARRGADSGGRSGDV